MASITASGPSAILNVRAQTQARRAENVALAVVALIKLLLPLASIGRYGYFRDELYYLASTRHLDWGYVEHPPLSIAVLALARTLFGDSLVAVRMVPVLAGAATVVLVGLLARRMGGGAYAQVVAALGATFSPVFLGEARYYSMNSLDLLIWTASFLVLAQILGAGDHERPQEGGTAPSPTSNGALRWRWLTLGALLGLGLLNKISVLWLGLGILAGLLVSRQRRQLATPWPWVAACVAALMFLPHVLWQAQHGWPTLEFMRNATERKMVAVPFSRFVIQQILIMSPALAPLWITGLYAGLFARWSRPYRVLALIYVTVFLVLGVAGRSRASYLALAYPPLLALGGIAFERSFGRPKWRGLRVGVPLVMVALSVPLVPFALPILPVETFIRYQHALGLAPHTEERHQMGALPQSYADMFGWEEMTALVAKAYQRLTPQERAHCRVFGQNYGEAGAIDVLGRRLGLPRAASGHNSYWLWGPGDWDGSVLIIIGGDREDNARFFDEVEIVGQVEAPYAMPYEQGLDVSIGRGLKRPVREVWPMLKEYI